MSYLVLTCFVLYSL